MQNLFSLGLLLLIASCTARDIPTHAETVNDYETVFPQIIRNSRDARSTNADESELIVTIIKNGETLTLHLDLNENLVAPSFTSIHYDDDGKEIITTGHANCYYQGKVEEHPKWIVVLNTCNGFNGFFGDMNNKSEYFRLAPITHSNPSLEQAHMLVTDTQTSSEAGTCATDGHSGDETIADHLETLASDFERVRRQSPNGDYIVEMAIVNDNRQYNHHGRSLSATVQNALDVVNAADMLYRPLDIRIVVVHVITWTSGDQINVVSDPNTLLENMLDYRQTVSEPHDAMMLLTGRDLSQNTVGIAFLNTLCGSASVGVVQEEGRSTSSSASTFAHELGHIFNMQHDISGCSCSDPSNRCVMAAVSGFPAPERWSSCSLGYLQDSLTRSSNNLGRCLENEPLTTVGDPVCGNGIREGDEVCDCGSSEECDDPCCDPDTCNPRAGAQCTKGACCTNTCQFKDYGTTCRSASGQCDIEEYCSGDSSECPIDVYQQDGTSCNSNQEYCFSGECQTYDDQCQYHFTSLMGATECFTSYNPQGDVFGNCGHTATDYLPCAQSDSMCGQLFCQPGNYQGRVSGVRLTIVTVRVFVNGQLRDCQGFTTDPGADIMSPGLVSDGTKCSDGHLCYEQECIPVEDLPGGSCPVFNGQVCSGRGECNNLHQCSCEVGFIGSACQTVNSGPTINECLNGVANCNQGCVDTEESYFCTCESGFRLANDGHTCVIECGDLLTTSSGTFSTPGYPVSYPFENFQCEWFIQLPNTGATIEFTINDVAFGIKGSPPCEVDNIEFFDGTSSNAVSLNKICGRTIHYPSGLPIITTTSSVARVVFTGTDLNRNANRVGVRVDYTTVTSQNECQINNGGCAHICIDTTQSFECTCETGYTLGSDERSCSDINECAQGTDNCDQGCSNTPGSFTCSCNAGYRLANDQSNCNDINECIEGSDDCDQRCTNTIGSFTCFCDSGFTLDVDGRSCIADVVEPLCGGVLNAATGSFQTPDYPVSYPFENFQCEWFIQLPNTGATIEFTINDVAFGIKGRPPCEVDNIEFFDGTSSNAVSLNKICGRTIHYPSGLPIITTTSSVARVVFTGTDLNRNANRVGVRVDYRTVTSQNECQINNGGCAHICIDTTQSFECTCETGYTLDVDGRSCIADVVEPLCGGVLNAATGSFQTPDWPTSYPFENFECEWIIQLPNTGATIEFTINDVAFGIKGRSPCPSDHIEFFDGTSSNAFSLNKICGIINHYPSGLPIITTTSSVARVVFTGSDLSRGSKRVGVKVDYKTLSEPVDECQVNNGPGYELEADGVTCVDIDECTDDNGGCNQNCFNFLGSYTCWCNTGYRLASDRLTCDDVDECSEQSDSCSQVCINTIGSYTCSCNAGFSLDSDGRSCTPQSGCGGLLTTASGSFQTDGWPVSYPFENFQCEWIIRLPNSGSRIRFTIDETAFGIKGRFPCPSDHIELFDGTSSNAFSLNKICGITNHYPSGLPIITTTSSVARVVFTGSDLSRGSKRVGIKVDYTTV